MKKKKVKIVQIRNEANNGTDNSVWAEFIIKHSTINILAAVVAVIIVFFAFLGALQNGFVNWDDNKIIYDNINIQSMGKQFWLWIFQFYEGNWCPLAWISHAADYALWGLRPFGHHLTSILLHAVNTFLFIILVIQLLRVKLIVAAGKKTDTPRRFLVYYLTVAVSSGLFFGLSPLRVESVVWIAERRDVLFLFFGLLSIISYLKYYENKLIKRSGKLFYILSLSTFLAGLMSKSMLVTLPVVLILIDIYPLQRFSFKEQSKKWQSVLIEKIPFLILSGLIAAVTYFAQISAKAVYSLVSMPVNVRFWISFRAYIFYLAKTLVPTDLSCLYLADTNIIINSPVYIGSFLLFFIITAVCFFLMRRTKLYVVIWGFYVVTLLPVVGIIQVGERFAADRYTYFPALGLSMIFGLAVGAAYRKLVPLNKLVTYPAVIAGVIVFFILGANTVLLQKQIGVWKDSISLWSQSIKLYPGIVSTPYKNRGVAYAQSGEISHAIEDFNTAIEISPLDSSLYVNRALALSIAGNQKGSIDDFIGAAKLGNPSAQHFLSSRGVRWQ